MVINIMAQKNISKTKKATLVEKARNYNELMRQCGLYCATNVLIEELAAEVERLTKKISELTKQIK